MGDERTEWSRAFSHRALSSFLETPSPESPLVKSVPRFACDRSNARDQSSTTTHRGSKVSETKTQKEMKRSCRKQHEQSKNTKSNRIMDDNKEKTNNECNTRNDSVERGDTEKTQCMMTPEDDGEENEDKEETDKGKEDQDQEVEERLLEEYTHTALISALIASTCSWIDLRASTTIASFKGNCKSRESSRAIESEIDVDEDDEAFLPPARRRRREATLPLAPISSLPADDTDRT